MAAKRTRTRGVVIPLVALFVAPGVVTAASAATPEIGAADIVVSQVRGRLGQVTRELAIKDNVYSEEVIETEADAATRIVFLDGTELSMGPSSRMVLDRYVYDPSAGTGEMALRMVTGVFQFASGNIPSDGYDLGTPFGNLAIRGTAIAVVISPQKIGVGVDEGGVQFRGVSIDASTGCFLGMAAGFGVDQFPGLGSAECEDELAPAQNLNATITAAAQALGLAPPPAVEPAAGPVSPDDFGVAQGPGAGDDPESQAPGGLGTSPPGFGAGGTSPQ